MMDLETNKSDIAVVGGGISGITSAVEAAEVGYNVVLIEKSPYLGGRVTRAHQYFPKLCSPNCGLEINFRRIKTNPRINVFTLAEVESISGNEGDYEVAVNLLPRLVNQNCTTMRTRHARTTRPTPTRSVVTHWSRPIARRTVATGCSFRARIPNGSASAPVTKAVKMLVFVVLLENRALFARAWCCFRPIYTPASVPRAIFPRGSPMKKATTIADQKR